MKVLSLYCGAGGIDEGLRQIGIKTTLAVDSERDCIETIKLNHDCETICSKVEDTESTLDNFDIVVGGPPCPEFSRAKTNRSLNPVEVNRFWSIVDKIKPKYYLMENVQDVIKVCNRKNYLINCANYGVPQTRIRRIFTNLPLPREPHSRTCSYDLAGNIIKKWVSVKDVLGLDVSDARQWYISPTGFSSKNKQEISRRIEEPIQTIVNANEYVLTTHKVMSQKYIKYRKETNTTKQNERKLSNKELSILQGFPESYKFHGSKSSIRKQIGNAVPPPITKAFFEQIRVKEPLLHNSVILKND